MEGEEEEKEEKRKRKLWGIPWLSSGWDSVLPLQGAQVQSLVGELRSCKPCRAAIKKKENYDVSLIKQAVGNVKVLSEYAFPAVVFVCFLPSLPWT